MHFPTNSVSRAGASAANMKAAFVQSATQHSELVVGWLCLCVNTTQRCWHEDKNVPVGNKTKNKTRRKTAVGSDTGSRAGAKWQVLSLCKTCRNSVFTFTESNLIIRVCSVHSVRVHPAALMLWFTTSSERECRNVSVNTITFTSAQSAHSLFSKIEFP